MVGGERVALGCGSGIIRLWDLVKGEETKVLEGHSGWIGCMSVLEDGSQLVLVPWEGEPRRNLFVLDLRVEDESAVVLKGHNLDI